MGNATSGEGGGDLDLSLVWLLAREHVNISCYCRLSFPHRASRRKVPQQVSSQNLPLQDLPFDLETVLF